MINGEPTDNDLATGRGIRHGFPSKLVGVAAHSAYPEQGIGD